MTNLDEFYKETRRFNANASYKHHLAYSNARDSVISNALKTDPSIHYRNIPEWLAIEGHEAGMNAARKVGFSWWKEKHGSPMRPPATPAPLLDRSKESNG